MNPTFTHPRQLGTGIRRAEGLAPAAAGSGLRPGLPSARKMPTTRLHPILPRVRP